MVYFFYGADSYRISQKVKNIIEQYQQKHKSGLNFSRFNFSDGDNFDGLRNFIDSYSMFAEKKLAIIDGLFETNKGLQEKFLEYLGKSDILKTQDKFIVVKQELARNEERKNGQKYALGDNKDFFKKLTSSLAKNEEFDLLTGAKLENWIKKETEENNAKIEPAAIRRLAASVGPDLWQMANEISKLALFCDGRIIGEKDINALVRAKIESDIFKTIDALAAKNKKAALEFLHRHLARGESEIYLLTMLIYQFRNLILVKDQIERGAQFQSLGKKIKMHPFVLRKTFEQSKGFTFPVLKKIYERLLEIDLGIKSGKIEAQAALDLVVGEIAG